MAIICGSVKKGTTPVVGVRVTIDGGSADTNYMGVYMGLLAEHGRHTVHVAGHTVVSPQTVDVSMPFMVVNITVS